MADLLLEVKDLTVKVEDKAILHKINLHIAEGETHVLMGPNGAGKSTLGYALMGNPRYELAEGRILFDGQDLTHTSVDKRAKAGLFLSFQNPLEVPGLSLNSFLKAAKEQLTGQRLKPWSFRKELKETMASLRMDEHYGERDLNVGFSGGEKKKTEILQLVTLQPKLAILDETDSGLDVDAVKTVSEGIKAFQESSKGALLIITHNTKILEALKVDKVHILVQGKIVKEGGAELITAINEHGFEEYSND